jgi:phosphinothricin acetyltransferase
MADRVVNVQLRDAHPADLGEILGIYNHAVETDTAVFDETPFDVARGQRWFSDKQGAGLPVIVAELEARIAGFGSYGPFRAWSGYARTVEHSLYVSATARRRGVGRALLSELIARAQRGGVHVMVAGLSADNDASLALHAAFGFERVGQMKEVGRKFGRWLDLVLLQRVLEQ